ncbi:MAG: M48 family metallopeptidase [Reyranellaceae bacterium]
MAADPSSIELELSDRSIAIAVRRARRARRFSLRLHGRDGGPELVLPPRAPLALALEFAAAQAPWLERHLHRIVAPQRLQPGLVLPLGGIAHRIEHRPGARGVTLDEAARLLLVGGRPEHAPRRLRDFLARRARAAIAPLAHEKAQRIGRRIANLAVRHNRSRWGSCSSDGRLSFTWHLTLTPDHVIDYLAAHEVAHLAEMNHSQRFWTLCRQLTSGDMEGCRAWLKEHGGRVLAIGL